jgi:hypothetical protein
VELLAVDEIDCGPEHKRWISALAEDVSAGALEMLARNATSAWKDAARVRPGRRQPVNSIVVATLVARILGGVFAIAGVFRGGRLQRQSADNERIRAAEAKRDDILATLAGPVAILIVRADDFRDAANDLARMELRQESAGDEQPADHRHARLEERFLGIHGEVIRLMSEISVLCERLQFLEPAMLPVTEQLAGAVQLLISDIGTASDTEFQTRLEEFKSANLAIERKRNELTGSTTGTSRKKAARWRLCGCGMITANWALTIRLEPGRSPSAAPTSPASAGGILRAPCGSVDLDRHPLGVGS